MVTKTTYYHPENGTRTFDLEQVSKSLLEEQGWCDHPFKAGQNPWGGDDEPMKAVHEAVKNGDLKRMDDDIPITSNEADNLKSAELDRAYRHQRVLEDENEALKRELRLSKEKLLDHRSDADKIREKGVGEGTAQAADRKKAADGQEEKQAAEEDQATDL